VILRIVICAALLGGVAAADIIRLKNGKTIVADEARQVNGRVEYSIGDNTYAISSRLVERIDAGGTPASSQAPAAGTPEVPLSAARPAASPATTRRVIRDGKVDVEALAEIDRSETGAVVAEAYAAAGRHEFQYGSFQKARSYLGRAAELDSENSGILTDYAALLLRASSYAEARRYAERAVRFDAANPDAYMVLGFVHFQTDRTRDAISAWKKSLELRPNPMVSEFLGRAEREVAAENGFGQQETGHFTLRYEGRQSSAALRRDILGTLEQLYDELVSTLGVAPRESIVVILYTEQAFFDVTQAPGWTGAVNDGKLRIPVEGVAGMTSELRRVLRHELAHSFIDQIARGRAPVWLHEGVAQLLEPRSTAGFGRALGRLFREKRNIPLNALEGSFMNLPAGAAQLAYAEALAAVEYVNETWGMSDVRRILERIGEGGTTEAVLRTTIRSNYSQLERDLGEFLQKKYGE